MKFILYYILQDADRIRRDSVIKEEVPKIVPEPVIVEPKQDEAIIEIAKLGLVTEEPENQNEQNNVGDYGIRAEALYDYQAGCLLIELIIKFKLIKLSPMFFFVFS